MSKVYAASGLWLEDVVRKNDSSNRYCSKVNKSGVCYMTQRKAIRYCKSQSQHLPSARELAQFSASLGANGIFATETGDAYARIAKNADGIIDKFYFSSTGYNRYSSYLEKVEDVLSDNIDYETRLDLDVAKKWFWSSSTDVEAPGYGMGLYSGGGGIENARVNEQMAVRCARNN